VGEVRDVLRGSFLHFSFFGGGGGGGEGFFLDAGMGKENRGESWHMVIY